MEAEVVLVSLLADSHRHGGQLLLLVVLLRLFIDDGQIMGVFAILHFLLLVGHGEACVQFHTSAVHELPDLRGVQDIDLRNSFLFLVGYSFLLLLIESLLSLLGK